MSISRSLVIAGALACATPAAGQQPGPPTGVCRFEFEPVSAANPPRVVGFQQASGKYNSFIGGNRFRGRCPAQSIVIVADSLEHYGDTEIVFLIGNVEYEEPRLKLNAQRVTYRQLEEHLRAERDVDATLPSGTNLKGPVVDYYRAVQGLRPRSRMVAPGRPTIRMVERDSAGRPGDPAIVVANTVVMEADSLVYASGNVELTRTDVVARGDSAYVDNGRQFARLMRRPVIEGKGERPFTLHGRVIDIFGRNRTLERALSKGEARAVSDDVTLTSDTLDFRLTESKLDRAFAWGASRARAVSPTYDILADSLDVRMPNQRVREVFAVGGAYAESEPDSTRIRSDERDWLRGDTIVATFDTTATGGDTTRKVSIRELLARGSASSFYQLAPRDTTTGVAAINYVRGRMIALAFDSQQVRNVTVTDRASGVYLEPGVAVAEPGTPRGAAPTNRPDGTPAPRPPTVQPIRSGRPSGATPP
ncbi:MAG: hypothetical protein M3373_04785 [Gemmatimonadota bacterium]|nr:hypothetical protein [Gemmatimonadota bacterium]